MYTYLKHFLILLGSLIVLMFFNGCQSSTLPINFDDLQLKVVGLQLYTRQHPEAGLEQVIKLSDEQVTQHLLDCLGTLPLIEPPPSPWDGAKNYLALSYIQEGKIIASKEYPYWHQDGGPGYLELEDGWHQVAEEFADQLAILVQYPEANGNIDPEDSALLKQYGWTAFYKIKDFSGKLPDRLLHESGEYPVTLYYAWNNEFCKDIGLDITPYLGKTVNINLYKIKEPLPAFMGAYQKEGRAVIVKDDERIVGAWLDGGSNCGFACSLKGQRLEKITGKSWGQWVNLHINHRHPQEILISQMQPEEVIETYFEAVDHRDSRTAHACETRKRLLGSLFANMDNNRLYNYSYANGDATWINNINRAKVINIQPYSNVKQKKEQAIVKTYVVEVDINVKRLITHDSGRQILYITLCRETLTTGWRIDSLSTAP